MIGRHGNPKDSEVGPLPKVSLRGLILVTKQAERTLEVRSRGASFEETLLALTFGLKTCQTFRKTILDWYNTQASTKPS